MLFCGFSNFANRETIPTLVLLLVLILVDSNNMGTEEFEKYTLITISLRVG